MPKVDFTFRSSEPEEPLYLDFSAARPQPAQRKPAASAPSPAEDRPLYLDLATRESQRRRPETTDQAFVGDPAALRLGRAPQPVRGAGSQRALLAVGLVAVVGLSVAVALWSYSALERRILVGGMMPAEPAPSAAPPGRSAEVAAVKPLAEIPEARIPAPLDTAAPAPSPAVRQEPLAEPAPEVASPESPEPRKLRRPQVKGPRPEAAAATARANATAASAPQSTLSAQSTALPSVR